ncbi:Tfp pilus assembly protein FimT/FimU [Acinetobacter nematophilus]
MRNNRGFTLIELMVTIAVLAIMAMIAAPSFQSLIQTNELKTGTDQVLFILNDAKNNARLTRQTSVLKLNSSASVPSTDKTFDMSTGLGANLSLVTDVGTISFLANGQIKTTKGEYPVCISIKHNKSLKVESVTISQLGLVTKSKTSC